MHDNDFTNENDNYENATLHMHNRGRVNDLIKMVIIHYTIFVTKMVHAYTRAFRSIEVRDK